MKTINQIIKNFFLAFGFMLLSTSFSKANSFALNNGENANVETAIQIKKHISFPNIILPIQESEKIEVVFTTGENGKVNFAYAKTNNETVKKEIEKQFLELTLPKIKSNVAYSVIINLKMI